MQDDRQELLTRLFVMLTARLEDAHELGTTGQTSGLRTGRLRHAYQAMLHVRTPALMRPVNITCRESSRKPA